MSKYRNSKFRICGNTFDSRAEGEYYVYLLGLQKNGKVKSIELQPVVELQPKFVYAGKTVRAITYIPDFLVEYTDGHKEYVDVKGVSTKDGELKLKMFMFKYQDGIPIKWVAKGDRLGLPLWMDYFEKKAMIRKRERERRKEAKKYIKM
ncbi:DUF1064 domain-containing protein [Anaerovibrio sp. RM50]|uniref:DUF1064 domain-containing protein n=1 Tax=Anaerovibrio sp. RM50 TaxID=1200557 RepID=UPI0004828652|nr:DUF1064 domain-containing protein [Anaerovibrio sp. RM50]